MSAIVSPISHNPRTRIARLVQLLIERQRADAEQERLADLDDYRAHLPIDHPYRHMLDSVDAACALMVCPTTGPCSCPPNGGAK